MVEASLVIALVLRFFHILFGIAWIGAVMYGVGVMRRALGKMDMAARKETLKKLMPVVERYLPGSAAMTIIFGVALYLYMGSFDPANLVGRTWGKILLTALVLALVAFAIGMIFGIGSAKKILGHLNEDACTHGPEVGALQKRFNMTQFINLGFGFAIVALMVIATEADLLGL
jgi:uncharacterized membrane protein